MPPCWRRVPDRSVTVVRSVSGGRGFRSVGCAGVRCVGRLFLALHSSEPSAGRVAIYIIGGADGVGKGRCACLSVDGVYVYVHDVYVYTYVFMYVCMCVHAHTHAVYGETVCK